MKTNAKGLALIKRHEGLRLNAYPDPATGGEPWTIGYGHTGDVKPGMRLKSEHEADVILQLDLEKFEDHVSRLCPGVNENQFAALVSLCFNIGPKRLEESTLRKRLLRGDPPAEVAAEFLKWKLAAGHVMPGLVKRRVDERALFLEPV